MSIFGTRRRHRSPMPGRHGRLALSAAALSALTASVALMTSPRADAGPVWSTVETTEAPAQPVIRTVMDAQDVVRSTAEMVTTSCIWIPPAIMECRVRDAHEQLDGHRRSVDSALDGPSDLVPPILESPPDGACVPLEERALTCTRGGSGGGSSGRTYYMGNRQYDCEYAPPSSMHTNHHLPKVVYNSMRFCRAMNGFVFSVRRDYGYDGDTMAYGSGPSGTLVSRSFSARFRRNYCENQSDRSSYVRCAYDWVR